MVFNSVYQPNRHLKKMFVSAFENLLVIRSLRLCLAFVFCLSNPAHGKQLKPKVTVAPRNIFGAAAETLSKQQLRALDGLCISGMFSNLADRADNDSNATKKLGIEVVKSSTSSSTGPGKNALQAEISYYLKSNFHNTRGCCAFSREGDPRTWRVSHKNAYDAAVELGSRESLFSSPQAFSLNVSDAKVLREWTAPDRVRKRIKGAVDDGHSVRELVREEKKVIKWNTDIGGAAAGARQKGLKLNLKSSPCAAFSRKSALKKLLLSPEEVDRLRSRSNQIPATDNGGEDSADQHARFICHMRRAMWRYLTVDECVAVFEAMPDALSNLVESAREPDLVEDRLKVLRWPALVDIFSKKKVLEIADKYLRLSDAKSGTSEALPDPSPALSSSLPADKKRLICEELVKSSSDIDKTQAAAQNQKQDTSDPDFERQLVERHRTVYPCASDQVVMLFKDFYTTDRQKQGNNHETFKRIGYALNKVHHTSGLFNSTHWISLQEYNGASEPTEGPPQLWGCRPRIWDLSLRSSEADEALSLRLRQSAELPASELGNFNLFSSMQWSASLRQTALDVLRKTVHPFRGYFEYGVDKHFMKTCCGLRDRTQYSQEFIDERDRKSWQYGSRVAP